MILDIAKKSFGDKLVLENIHLELAEAGGRYIIEGPSGCGKTTLLRIIAGLDTDYAGTIKEPFSYPAVLFQENRLIESLSLESNLRAVTDDRDRIIYVLEMLGLSEELKNHVSELSGGMKRRAAIARALLSEYSVLLLDEPFAGLDDGLIGSVSEFILKEAGSRTVAVVSHDREDERRFKAEPIILQRR